MTVTSLVLRSKYSEKPLAQIIVSGNKFDVTVDNSGGTLDRFDHDLSALQSYVSGSSHLTLEQTTDAIPTFLRFLLNTGDVLEVTEDGRVALLNGEFLSPEEQLHLAAQIQSGAVQAKGEASKYQAVPQPPKFAPPPQIVPDSSRWIYLATGKAEARQKKRQEQDEQSSKYYDDVIEGAKFDTIDPEFTKNLAYGFQYNTVGKGGEDA